jgi:cell division protein FtsZ
MEDYTMSLASERDKIETEILDIITGGMTEPRMVIIGCGGAGCNTINRMSEYLKGVPRIAINTDMNSLQAVDADRKIGLGKTITFGNDSGGFTEVAQRSAELAIEEIRSCLISKDIAFIVAGFGGGTGAGISPMVAETAKGLGMVTFGIGILPFSAETQRRERAEAEIDGLRQMTDSTIVLDNDALMKFGDVSLDNAFRIMDKMVVKIIKDVTDTMGRSYLATLANEVLAFQNDMQVVSVGDTMGYQPSDIGAYADTGMPPNAYPTESDQNLVQMGGLFERL